MSDGVPRLVKDVVVVHLHQNIRMPYTNLAWAFLECHARPRSAVFLCCQLCPEYVCSILVDLPILVARLRVTGSV